MRFAFAFGSLAALAATAAAAPAPQAATDSQYGSWALNYTWNSAANGWKQEKFEAVYSVDGSSASQIYTYSPWLEGPEKESTVSDPASFVGSYNGSYVFLQQTVVIENTNVTIYGNAPLETSCKSPTGRLCKGSATVEVTQAVA
ncbi:hypothetical protein MPH_13170 [Macrophomina phaseolina MS6]|uniref:Uncharacterized protein n=1 Tax=Macrophomina phaseolina (strain MS6) TaxID=1126212 RepID=K2RA48_MACPH|nr:hypothetical protein MPH_13170 [Macrophomina phaseolina MS6]